MTDSYLQKILVALPVLSGGLYLMGVANHQGYLYAFGISDSLFPLAYDSALLSGWLALEMVSPVPLLYTLQAGFVLTCAVMVAVLLSSYPRVKHYCSIVLAKLRKGRATNAPSKAMDDLAGMIGTILWYVLGVFVVLLLLAFAAFFSSRSGQDRAVEEMRFFNDPASNYAILYSHLLPEPTRSKQIICGQSHCAFWLGSKTLVLRHDSIERVEMHNPRVEKMLGDKAAQRPSP